MIENSNAAGFSGAEHISNEELLELDCDLLVPAALGGVITMENVDNIKAKYIVEGANGPIDADADEMLFQSRRRCVTGHPRQCRRCDRQLF